MKKAFTLAEILIVLAVIGIITAILLPAAHHITPDKNALKFKKANATLGRVIRELVSSDEYYLDGDLGVRPNGDLINGEHAGDDTYFCETFAQLLSTKKVNCSKDKSGYTNNTVNRIAYVDIGLTAEGGQEDTVESAGPKLDAACKTRASIVGAEITTQDNVIFYQTVPNTLYGMTWGQQHASNASQTDTCEEHHPHAASACVGRFFGGVHRDVNGFDRLYRTFCMDIDGIGVGEDPFGYGIRADGKILYGKRASEWIEKSIQNKD